MTNPVGAISFDPKVTLAQPPAPATKPAVNVAKATPQDSVNISAAGRAASQSQPAQKASSDVDHDGDSK
jgi:hypothetical protein